MAPFEKKHDAISNCEELEQLREQIAQMERSNLVQSGRRDNFLLRRTSWFTLHKT